MNADQPTLDLPTLVKSVANQCWVEVLDLRHGTPPDGELDRSDDDEGGSIRRGGFIGGKASGYPSDARDFGSGGSSTRDQGHDAFTRDCEEIPKSEGCGVLGYCLKRGFRLQ